MQVSENQHPETSLNTHIYDTWTDHTQEIASSYNNKRLSTEREGCMEKYQNKVLTVGTKHSDIETLINPQTSQTLVIMHFKHQTQCTNIGPRNIAYG